VDDAARHVARLRAELDADPAATSRRQAAARLRAATERQARVQRALAREAAIAAARPPQLHDGGQRRPPRASTTDPDATVMKMGDGGFRPALNAQFATDTGSQIIVGVAVTNLGSDQGQLVPMLDQVRRRYGRRPDAVLVDGGYTGHATITEVTRTGCVLYAPIPRTRPRRARYLRQPHPAPAVIAWRARMATATAQAIYRERAATAECIHALARQRGLQHLRVRGLAKVRAILLWFAVAHNLLRASTVPRVAAAPA